MIDRYPAQGPLLLLVPRTPRQIDGYIGDVGSVLLTMFGPKQHDWHVLAYRRIKRDRRLAADVAKVIENMRLGRPKWEGV